LKTDSLKVVFKHTGQFTYRDDKKIRKVHESMVSDTMKMEDPAYGAAFGEQPQHSWSKTQVNQIFYIQELRFLFGNGD
jgi:hypothetical protein